MASDLPAWQQPPPTWEQTAWDPQASAPAYDASSAAPNPYAPPAGDYAAQGAGYASSAPQMPHAQSVYVPSDSPSMQGQFSAPFDRSAMTQIGLQYTAHAMTAGQTYLQQNMNRYVDVPTLRYYFQVDNAYVGRKLLLMLFPFLTKVRRRFGAWNVSVLMR